MVIQEANSGLVQKVQPNDKSGKLLPNNHTKGRKRAPGHLMSKGCVRRPAKRRGAVAVSLAFETTCIPSTTDLPVAHAPAKVAH